MPFLVNVPSSILHIKSKKVGEIELHVSAPSSKIQAEIKILIKNEQKIEEMIEFKVIVD